MDKSKLDEIIEKNKAQPIGHGYIDIIVLRDSYKAFATDLITNGFIIERISWWEWCTKGNVNEYGLGGPKSYYYEGWFAELSIEVDDIELAKAMKDETMIEEIVNRIEAKTISFLNEKITFKQSSWLTPAFWLDVPDEWRNKYSLP